MSGGEGREGGGKLPSVDHGRRTDEGRDKKEKGLNLGIILSVRARYLFVLLCYWYDFVS